MEQIQLLTVPQANADAEDSPTSSRPPSPPDSGTVTPRVTIAPHPSRLTPFYPPPNYGCVDEDKVYRSAFPQDRNVDFIDGLGIRSVLTLVDTEPALGFQAWLEEGQLRHAKIHISTNKDKSGKIDADLTAIYRALLFLMDSSNQPVYVHCNQGKHRTGCVIGCLRRIQGWPVEEVIKEYEIYAGFKSRPGDLALIKAFDPALVYEQAIEDGILDSLSRSGNARVRMVRSDSTIADIYALRAALEAGMLGESEWDDGHATDLEYQLNCFPTPVERDSSDSWSIGDRDELPSAPDAPPPQVIEYPEDVVMNDVSDTVRGVMDSKLATRGVEDIEESVTEPKIATPGVDKMKAGFMEAKITTRGIDEMEEGTMTGGIEAGC